MVRHVDLTIRQGEIVGLVGESGSGKTITALAMARLLPPGAEIVDGKVEITSDSRSPSGSAKEDRRSGSVRMVFQEPASALNPVLTVGFQIREALGGRGMTGEEERREAYRLLSLVGIAGARERLRDYPHQFSGGQRQRVLIAMALAAEPALLIADEATSALDVTMQAQILELLVDLRRRLDLALLIITHDLSLVKEICDRVVVMYAGQVVEEGEVKKVFGAPSHPYTRALIQAIPTIGSFSSEALLPTLPGETPDFRRLPAGCSFFSRCSEAMDRCQTEAPELIELPSSHLSRCLLHDEISVRELSS